MLPWRSGRNQLRVPPALTPRRSPAGLTIESVVPAPLAADQLELFERG